MSTGVLALIWIDIRSTSTSQGTIPSISSSNSSRLVCLLGWDQLDIREAICLPAINLVLANDHSTIVAWFPWFPKAIF
jgi:hypothetical protein